MNPRLLSRLSAALLPAMLALLPATLALIGLGTPSTATAQIIQTQFRPPGDINGDLRVTVTDAILALQIISGGRPSTADDRAVIDVAPRKGIGTRTWGDGRVDVSDVIRLLRRAVGAEPDPWPGGVEVTPITRAQTLTLTYAGGIARFDLPSGYKVDGTLQNEKGVATTGEIYLWNATSRQLARTDTDANGKFALAVPPGQYSLSVRTRVEDRATGSVTWLSQPDLATVTVSTAHVTLTQKRPALPTLLTVQGALTAALPTGLTATTAEFVDEVRRYEQTPPPTRATGTVSPKAAFTLLVPKGAYKPFLNINEKDSAGALLGTARTLPPQSAIQVNGNWSTYKMSLPLFGSLSGKISITGSTAPLASGRILAETSAREQYGAEATGNIAAGKYYVPLQRGIVYRLGLLPDAINPTQIPNIGLTYIPSSQSVNGDKTQDFTLPAPPPKSNPIPMWVGDEYGRPVPNARISLLSKTLTNANAGYQEQIEATTNDQGGVTLSIPDGQYDLLVQPSVARPSVIPIPPL